MTKGIIDDHYENLRKRYHDKSLQELLKSRIEQAIDNVCDSPKMDRKRTNEVYLFIKELKGQLKIGDFFG